MVFMPLNRYPTGHLTVWFVQFVVSLVKYILGMEMKNCCSIDLVSSCGPAVSSSGFYSALVVMSSNLCYLLMTPVSFLNIATWMYLAPILMTSSKMFQLG